MAHRYDPFRDLDRLADRMFGSVSEAGQALRAMPIDLYRDDNHWVLQCDLPGVDPESIDMDVDGRVLTIRAVRAGGPEGVEWLAAERVSGTFARQLTLGDGVDLDGIQASYNNGVLTLTLPVAEAAKPRKISINAGEAEPVSITPGE